MSRAVEAALSSLQPADGARDEPAVDPEVCHSPELFESREAMADLCSHIAHALKALESDAHPLASYRAPNPGAVPTLDIRR
jgi:hypothetical protein